MFKSTKMEEKKKLSHSTLLSRLNNSILWRTANRTIFPTDCFSFLKIYENVECLSDFIFVAAAAAAATLVVKIFPVLAAVRKSILYTRSQAYYV